MVGEGDVDVGEGATMVEEEDNRVGEEDAAAGHGGSEVCGGRKEDGEEHGRQFVVLQSEVEGKRRY